jgi:glycosyltransferase involved in cell wall biosynthesis
LWREVRRCDAVLLHESLYPTSIAAFVAAKVSRRPLVLTQHIATVPYRNPALRWLMRAATTIVARPMVRAAEQVVFISQSTARAFERVKRRRAPHLIFNGVDTRIFRPLPLAEAAAVRRDLGLDEARPVVLFVGRFVEKKGLHLLREMAARRPDLIWAFAGWGPIDPDRWGLANVRVFRSLAGESLARLYAAADLFVLPSTGEGLPLVIQEALACGLPVVCEAETARADPAAAPLLVAVAPPAEVASAAAAYLEAVDGALERLPNPTASAGRAQFAARQYSWPAAADRYAALLQAVATESGPGDRAAQDRVRTVAAPA